MACCLTAPSHYLNQCWLIISSNVYWHSSEGNFTAGISAINHCNWLEKYSSKISLKSPRPQWVKMCGHFKSFIVTEMYSILDWISRKRRIYTLLTVSIMAADGLATQGARTSAAMVLTGVLRIFQCTCWISSKLIIFSVLPLYIELWLVVRHGKPGTLLILNIQYYGCWWPGNIKLAMTWLYEIQIDGLVQDCSISSALAIEILQYCHQNNKLWFFCPE